MSKSRLDIFVTIAEKLKTAFKINGKATDGTNDVNIDRLALTTLATHTPASIINSNTSLTNGYLAFRTLASNIDPIRFTTPDVYAICNCVIGTDTITMTLIVESTGSIFIYSGTSAGTSWLLKSEVGRTDGNVAGSDTLATPRLINNTLFDGSSDIETNKWGKSRTISYNGDLTGSTSIDGSANIVLQAMLSPTGIVAGSYAKVTVDAKGRVTGYTTLNATDIPNLDASKINVGTFAEARIPVLTAAKIPGLDASKLISGTIPSARIGSISASSIDSGELSPLRIPSIDASKINTGTFGVDRIPSLPVAKITGLGQGAYRNVGYGTGELLEAGSGGIVKHVDLRSNATTNGPPSAHWGTGTRFGFTSSLELGMGGVSSDYGVIMSNGQYTDASGGAGSASRVFFGAGYILYSYQYSATTWSPPVSLIHTGNIANNLPAIDASKITSGTISGDRLPVIPSSKMPYLDTSYITTGILSEDRLNTYIVSGALATFSTRANIDRLKIKIPFSINSNIMLTFDIIVYSSYAYSRYTITGYLYGTANNWYSPKIFATGDIDPDFYFGYDANLNAYISINSAMYTGVTVRDLTIGYSDNDDVQHRTRGWSIVNEASIPNAVRGTLIRTINNQNIGAHIPAMSADKITWGTFGVDRIPQLPFSKITGSGNMAGRDIFISTAEPNNATGKEGDLWGVIQ